MPPNIALLTRVRNAGSTSGCSISQCDKLRIKPCPNLLPALITTSASTSAFSTTSHPRSSIQQGRGSLKTGYTCNFSLNSQISRGFASSTYTRNASAVSPKYSGRSASNSNTGPGLPKLARISVTNTQQAKKSLHKLTNPPKSSASSTVVGDQAPLLSERQYRQQLLQEYRPCTTVSSCEKYNLTKAIDLLYGLGLKSARILLAGEIAHVLYPFSRPTSTTTTNETSTSNVEIDADVLVLANGTVVVWGMTEQEVLQHIVKPLKEAELRSYRKPESEDMDYVEVVNSADLDSIDSADSSAADGRRGEQSINKSTMRGDVIVISGSTATDRLLAKAAFSSGLARSTKLGALETSLDAHIDSTKPFIDNLASARALGIRGSRVLMLKGQLLQIRGQLNLYSELIETAPDLYWEEPALEELYALISKKLDVNPRIAILNNKLDYASESVNTLRSHISEEHGIRLEWMIIILIMVEVGFEIFHFVGEQRGLRSTKASDAEKQQE